MNRSPIPQKTRHRYWQRAPLMALAALSLLHLSLLLRVVGDMLLWLPGRRWGGLLNGVVVLLFLLVTAVTIIRGRWLQARLS